MTKIFKYFTSRDWGTVLVSLVLIVFQVFFDLRLPDYMSEITKLVQTEGSEMGDILLAGAKMMGCALGSLAAAFCVGFFFSRLAAGLSKRLRGKVYDRVMSFSMEEINKFSTPSLITRTTNDITQIQMIIAMGLQIVIKAPITAAWAIVKIYNKNVSWTTATAVCVGVLILIILTIVLVAMPKFRRLQTLTDNLNRITRENLTGIRVVRAYNAEQYQEDKFEVANDDVTKTNLFANRVMAILSPGMTIIMNGLTLSIYWIGAVLINNAAMTERLGIFSDMVVFTSYAMQVIMSFMMLTMIFILLPRATVSAKRIMEVLNTKPRIIDGTLTGADSTSVGEVEFRNVSFKYPGAEGYVLRDINFKAKRGETVAFIGSTGSGKSTLINLIPRFYDATEGSVLVDGIDVKQYKQSELINKIGYVTQKSIMFSGSVRSNVAYGEKDGKNPTEEDVRRAIRIAQAEEFVSEMPSDIDSPIAQGGTNVSGGQKQRLSIARAICRNPEIYIFDDSFSALDYKTDRILRSALKKEMADATNFIVAQRIGTIRDADKIVVLDEGHAVGIGTHDELMKTCEVYRQIAYSQLSKEELENA